MKQSITLSAMAIVLSSGVVASGQTILLDELSQLYTISGGTFNSGTGGFSRSGTDVYQGVVGSFTPVPLENVGDAVSASFSWQGTGANNQAQRFVPGFFSGDPVTMNDQISVTDDWEGYFHAIATRSSAGNVNFGVYRQGDGSQPLFDRENNWSGGNASVNGEGARQTGGDRPPIQSR